MKTLKKILYVEDDYDLQQVVSMSLEDIGGYELKICGTGSEALIEAQEFNPDLFLLDVLLPDISGPSVLRQLRKMPQFKNTAAIFISAKVLGHELMKYRELGALGIIRKPFDPITISKTINVLYQSNEHRSPDMLDRSYIIL